MHLLEDMSSSVALDCLLQLGQVQLYLMVPKSASNTDLLAKVKLCDIANVLQDLLHFLQQQDSMIHVNKVRVYELADRKICLIDGYSARME